jgi:hypothetical protein
LIEAPAAAVSALRLFGRICARLFAPPSGKAYCIQGHTRAALRAGASQQELMEAVWVAAKMRAGGACAHATMMIASAAQEEQAAGGRVPDRPPARAPS